MELSNKSQHPRCWWFSSIDEGLHLKPPKFKHIFVASHNFPPPPPPPPLFCADTFDTSLLFIVCALRWYVKCLYRRLILEDTSKKARVTQILHLPNCGKNNFKAPWSTDAQIGLWLAKQWCGGVNYFLGEALWIMMIRRGEVTDIAWVFARLEMNCHN